MHNVFFRRADIASQNNLRGSNGPKLLILLYEFLTSDNITSKLYQFPIKFCYLRLKHKMTLQLTDEDYGVPTPQMHLCELLIGSAIKLVFIMSILQYDTHYV